MEAAETVGKRQRLEAGLDWRQLEAVETVGNGLKLGWAGLDWTELLEVAETVGKPAERSKQRGERRRDLKTERSGQRRERRRDLKSQNREEKINLGPAESVAVPENFFRVVNEILNFSLKFFK